MSILGHCGKPGKGLLDLEGQEKEKVYKYELKNNQEKKNTKKKEKETQIIIFSHQGCSRCGEN